jgi:DNA polymerase-3 subunit epsilon
MNLRAIYFDLETTGRDVERNRIVEIAAYDPLKDASFQQLVNPGGPIPPDATQIHGITDAMVQGAPSLGEAARQFIEFCSGEVMLVAHNGLLFDLPFLQAEFGRHKVLMPENWVFVDSLQWARKYRPDLPRHALQYLRQVFGIPENTAHRALEDAMTLYRVFSLMVDDLSCEEILARLQGGERPGKKSAEQRQKETRVLELF